MRHLLHGQLPVKPGLLRAGRAASLQARTVQAAALTDSRSLPARWQRQAVWGHAARVEAQDLPPHSVRVRVAA